LIKEKTQMNWQNAKSDPSYETSNNEKKNFDILKKSIESLSAIDCYYKNAWVNGEKVTYHRRIFEPFQILKNHKGHLLVLGYFVSGYTQWNQQPPFKTYKLGQFRQLRVVPRKTRIVRPDFKGGSFKGMQVLVDIMDYAKIKNPKNQKIVPNISKNKDVKRNDLNTKEKVKYDEPEKEQATGAFEDEIEDDSTKD
jgi:hypothetical protein